MEKEKDVMATYKFPNGMVVTFDFKDEQITELQGRWTPELENKIRERSSAATHWNGFEFDKGITMKQIRQMIIGAIALGAEVTDPTKAVVAADDILMIIAKIPKHNFYYIKKHYLNENELP